MSPSANRTRRANASCASRRPSCAPRRKDQSGQSWSRRHRTVCACPFPGTVSTSVHCADRVSPRQALDTRCVLVSLRVAKTHSAELTAAPTACRSFIRAVSDETPSTPAFLLGPFYTARPHPSGINAVSLFAKGAPRPLCRLHRHRLYSLIEPTGDRLWLATAGDDNAIVLSCLSITSVDESLRAAELGKARLPTAHSSTIQGQSTLCLFLTPGRQLFFDIRSSAGLEFVHNGTGLISSSVDQRLNTYCLSSSSSRSESSDSVSISVSLADSTCLDVADCSAQAVVVPALASPQRRGDESRVGVVVVGIGAEVVWLGDGKKTAAAS